MEKTVNEQTLITLQIEGKLVTKKLGEWLEERKLNIKTVRRRRCTGDNWEAALRPPAKKPSEHLKKIMGVERMMTIEREKGKMKKEKETQERLRQLKIYG